MRYLMAGNLVIHRGTVGLPDAALIPGRLCTLEVPFAESARLPPGVALDDYLADADRPGVDAEARAALDAWRARRGADLHVEGLDLGHVWEVELLAECFLPAARLRAALPPLLGATAPDRLVGVGLEPDLLRLVADAGVEAGVTTVAGAGAAGSTGPIPRAASPAAARIVAAAGLPRRVRGSVLCVPYWHLEPVLTRLALAPRSPRPVAIGSTLPLADPRAMALAAIRGGWLGHPSRQASARSRRRLDTHLARLTPDARGGVDAALDALALALLRRRAGNSLGQLQRARAAFAAGRLKRVLIPYDSPEVVRVLLSAAREAGVPSLLVQHGFDAALNDPDKSVADHVAVWSRSEAEQLARRDLFGVTVTGNPGAAHLASFDPPEHRPGEHAIVLVEYPGRLSTTVRARAGGEHVATALDALAQLNYRRPVIIRPHPADPAPDAYLRLAAAQPGLDVRVDTSTPIEPLLTAAELCVGALSTAALQSAAVGTPTVHLDVAQLPRPWPFGGESGLPRATCAQDLAELLAAEPTARQPALEALGARPDAVEAVLALV